ncbi:unnamed protein product [Cochlearia groenlandica]
MERLYKCRYCVRSFINGSALGGHMRSHMLNLSSSSSFSKRDLYEDNYTESYTSFDDDDEERENRVIKKMKTSQPSDSITELDHNSSDSDTTTEKDLAFCLIMLSRDKWDTKQIIEEEEEEEEEEGEYKSNKNRGGRGRFKCETCSKVFRSYQALGGHRASHKKNKTKEEKKTEYVVNGEKKKKSSRGHECPVCLRVFSSGQALGGHKRSHGTINVGSTRKVLSLNQIVKEEEEEEVLVKQRMIDLNFPPSSNEEDDDYETSLVFDEC